MNEKNKEPNSSCIFINWHRKKEIPWLTVRAGILLQVSGISASSRINRKKNKKRERVG